MLLMGSQSHVLYTMKYNIYTYLSEKITNIQNQNYLPRRQETSILINYQKSDLLK